MKKSLNFYVLNILLALLLFSCSMSDNSKLKKKLSDKYNEKFTIHSHGYNWVLKTYQFSASPQKNTKIFFGGEHNEDFVKFTDNYVSEIISYKYVEELREELGQYCSPMYLFANLMFNDEITEVVPIDIDTLEFESVFSKASSINFYIYCCYFKELNEKNKIELLSGIDKLIGRLVKYKNTHINLEAYFWNEDFLKEHSVDDLEFDHLKSNHPDVGREFRKYVNRGLDIYLKSEEAFIPFNVDSLYNWSKTVTPDAFGVSVTNLNKMWEKLQRE